MNGLPVMLSKKFCFLRLPLDIDEHEFFLPAEEFGRVVDSLSPEGWNQKGKIHNLTVHRGIQLLSRCREEILDMALGIDFAISPQEIEWVLPHITQAVNSNL